LFLFADFDFSGPTVPDFDFIRAAIERMRIQVRRQRREILQIQKAGIATASAKVLLQRMLDSIDGRCADRNRMRAEQPKSPKVLGGGNGEILR
jgi:hypothetical protein